MKRKSDANLATHDADLVGRALAAEAEASSADGMPDPRRWLALTMLLVAACMDMLDVSIVNVGVPSIQSGLSANYAAVEWVLAGYTLAFAAGLITGGRIGDLYGRKRMFLLGTAVFTVASALCGAAADPAMLIAARVLQGCGAAVMVPQVLSIIQVTFPERERPAALGAYGAAAGLATISGPLLGGVLLHANLFSLGWRPIFLVNVVIGALALIVAAVLVRESRATSAQRLDLGGVTLVSAALIALVYPLVQGRDLHWPWWCFALLGLSLLLLTVFVRYEQRLARVGGSPLVAMSLFTRRSFSFGTALTLSFMLGVASFYLILSLYLQIGLGYTPLHAGLTTVPSSIGLAVAAVAASKLVPRLGRRLLAPGGVLSAVSIVWMILTFHQQGAAITSWQIAPSMFALGLGMGIVVPSLIDAALADVPAVHAGS
ncbi:MAG: MFS transporter, partial [Trebonia sp.]